MLDYILETYGREYVAQIILFRKFKTRAIIRAVAQALNIDNQHVKTIDELIPNRLFMSVERAVELEPRLQDYIAKHAQLKSLFVICRGLEGLICGADIDSSGIVISDQPIAECCPIYSADTFKTKGRPSAGLQTQTKYIYSIKNDIGFVQFDFLGQHELTHIHNILLLIEKNGKTVPKLSSLNMDDPATCQMFSKGDTSNVYQFESTGIKSILKRMKPQKFADLVAIITHYRPESLKAGMMDDFIERKINGGKPFCIHPALEPILAETYGLILYSEQIMLIAQLISNLSLVEADALAETIKKTDPAQLKHHRNRFLDGAENNGNSRHSALGVYEELIRYGKHALAKSHAINYAMLAYRMAYLKANFSEEFRQIFYQQTTI